MKSINFLVCLSVLNLIGIYTLLGILLWFIQIARNCNTTFQECYGIEETFNATVLSLSTPQDKEITKAAEDINYMRLIIDELYKVAYLIYDKVINTEQKLDNAIAAIG